MNDQYAGIIASLPLFTGYTLHGAQRLLSYGEIKGYGRGELLFKEGDAPAFVLLVLAGKLQVFVERHGREVILTDAGPNTVLGELAVLCGIPRSASVRVLEESTVLKWEATAFRRLLVSDPSLSERIFRESLRTLIEKERSLIASLTESQAGNK
ncbi:MAG: Crp/Fnr family transcriptional regulator [Pyrinomonadaceae bacterium]